MEMILVYAEALADLSPAQIDAACRITTKYMKEVFPKPGHIRDGLYGPPR